jgi:hypothetical protein
MLGFVSSISILFSNTPESSVSDSLALASQCKNKTMENNGLNMN